MKTSLQKHSAYVLKVFGCPYIWGGFLRLFFKYDYVQTVLNFQYLKPAKYSESLLI